MLVADLVARIGEEVADLKGRVRPAAELAELNRQKAMPQGPATAFVLPLGLRPMQHGQAVVNAYTQELMEVFAVVLVVRGAGDVTGGKALPTIDRLIWAVIAAVCGWAPDDAAPEPDTLPPPFVTGVFQLVRGELLTADAGAIQYQLDFGLFQQLRIIA